MTGWRQDAPVTVAAPLPSPGSATATTGGSAIPPPPPPVVDAGPVNVYHGPAAADYADATNADEPVSAPLGELANVGADPTALAGYVLDNAVPAPEEPAP